MFEHLKNINRILQRIKHARGTFSGPKMIICSNHITIVGFECSYEGKRPINDAIRKILCWGPCKDITNIVRIDFQIFSVGVDLN